ncbi:MULTISPECIES: sugar phosphate nucleotidyltransferase [Thermotoga]|uniref:Nucleotidyl transferase n=4 Tax=Thermotoga TaxID=2335 RepID=A5IMG5_THEP1|nr:MULTISPECIES: sugar phosphate nucleotidyltransferase [Thermotoga]KUK23809.1 MAG: Nucleotidyl transferase [Thermotoga petrophila]KUK33737.1 MAG: Nucleotidyl transferase [Thermotoga sp. 47_83]MDK2893557.1 1L-myo-inositol 1-phosphate cytidylyltransferase [Thermotoga sp.]ABQ47388.1 Nucleotidyl transferase [Thermotoga petrophila RKU-1]ACB09656.1 nucleotidyl transferase [Thermotoga sp. RQ2]
MREAVVLASGAGKRLRSVTGDVPKVFYRFDGCELVKYPMISLMKNGVERFVLVVSEGYRDLGEKVLNDLGVEGIVVENKKVELGNAYSFFLSEPYVESEKFFLSCGDSLFPPEALKSAFSEDEFHIKLGVSKRSDLIDPEEASKVLVNEDRIVKIGKRIDEYNYFDTGVFVMTKKVYSLKESFSWTEEISLYHVLQKAVDTGMLVKVFDFGNALWTEIDSPEDLNEKVYELMKKIKEGVAC